VRSPRAIEWATFHRLLTPSTVLTGLMWWFPSLDIHYRQLGFTCQLSSPPFAALPFVDLMMEFLYRSFGFVLFLAAPTPQPLQGGCCFLYLSNARPLNSSKGVAVLGRVEGFFDGHASALYYFDALSVLCGLILGSIQGKDDHFFFVLIWSKKYTHFVVFSFFFFLV
jgi:hypothetical protein